MSKKQLFYEDVEIGQEIPTLVKETPVEQMARWAGVSGDFHAVHYDKGTAQELGFTDAIVQGKLKAAFLTQLVTDWIGKDGWLKKLTCEYRRLDMVREKIICRGKVLDKYIENEGHLIKCEIWLENPRGERTTSGTALIVLPSRA